MKKHVRLFLLVLLTTPMLAIEPRVPNYVYPGDGSGGGGSSTTCTVQCPDGSWSGIGCNTGETAHCTCTGSPVQANPYCT